MSTSKLYTARKLEYVMSLSGILAATLVLITAAAAGFLPPPKPTWTTDEVVAHYKKHKRGVSTGAALLMMVSLLYPMYAAAISSRMLHIPRLHPIMSQLQLACGAAGALIFLHMGVLLACIEFRLDRPAAVIEVLHNLFWLYEAMGWPLYMVQWVSFVYASIKDTSERLAFPRILTFVNITVIIIGIPGMVAVRVVKTGPIAWDGAICFWLALFAWGGQFCLESICIARNIFIQAKEKKRADSEQT